MTHFKGAGETLRLMRTVTVLPKSLRFKAVISSVTVMDRYVAFHQAHALFFPSHVIMKHALIVYLHCTRWVQMIPRMFAKGRVYDNNRNQNHINTELLAYNKVKVRQGGRTECLL